MKRRVLWSIAPIALIVLAAALLWPSGSMGSRDLGCGATTARSREICDAISKSMEWTWTGHAIISPGWRPTWKSVAQVWCGVKITSADLPTLDALRRASPDWRLESAADSLIRIAKNQSGAGDEPENSIFNPKNPEYILKNGCEGSR